MKFNCYFFGGFFTHNRCVKPCFSSFQSSSTSLAMGNSDANEELHETNEELVALNKEDIGKNDENTSQSKDKKVERSDEPIITTCDQKERKKKKKFVDCWKEMEEPVDSKGGKMVKFKYCKESWLINKTNITTQFNSHLSNCLQRRIALS